jgi:hypothetical protein
MVAHRACQLTDQLALRRTVKALAIRSHHRARIAGADHLTPYIRQLSTAQRSTSKDGLYQGLRAISRVLAFAHRVMHMFAQWRQQEIDDTAFAGEDFCLD